MGAPQARNSWLLYMAVRKSTADGKDSHRNDHAADHPGDWLADADGEVAEGRNEPKGENHLSDELQAAAEKRHSRPAHPLKDISQDDQNSHGGSSESRSVNTTSAGDDLLVAASGNQATAAGARKITKASATSHQQKYMKIPLFAPFCDSGMFPCSVVLAGKSGCTGTQCDSRHMCSASFLPPTCVAI